MISLSAVFRTVLGVSYQARNDEFVSPEIDIWFLRRTTQAKPPPENLPFRLTTCARPETAFYRDLYKTVGGPWMWWERLAMGDEALQALFLGGQRLLVLPEIDGKPAGFSELHFISSQVTEITYFGFRPEFVGKGLAKLFMEEVVRLAWCGKPGPEICAGVREIRLNTCSLDHPRARAFYRSVGYVEYDTRSGAVHIPKHLLFPDLIASRPAPRVKPA